MLGPIFIKVAKPTLNCACLRKAPHPGVAAGEMMDEESIEGEELGR